MYIYRRNWAEGAVQYTFQRRSGEGAVNFRAGVVRVLYISEEKW